MRTPMETGETNRTATGGMLVLGWDGETLFWLALKDRRVQEYGSEVFSGDWSSIRAKMGSYPTVRVTWLRPVFSLLPVPVAEGLEQEVMALQHGKTDLGLRTFRTDRLGEALLLIENDLVGVDDSLNVRWPLHTWSSATLGWLESKGKASVNSGFKVSVFINIGRKRAVMCRFHQGSLRWCLATEDLEGTGLLYHVVNSMVRDNLNPQIEKVEVEIGGDIQNDRPIIEDFSRFFAEVRKEDHGLVWSDGEPKVAGAWSLLQYAI